VKILFATMPVDGHFAPLTGIAAHLRSQGHDVRWYAGPSYEERLTRAGIPAFLFQRASEVNGENIHALYPERAGLKGPKLISFDGERIFAANVANHYQDILEIHAGFAFEAFFCDSAFFASKLVAEKLGVPVYGVGVSPLLASSRDVPPPFFGLKPSRNPFRRLVHAGVRVMLHSGLRQGVRTYNRALVGEGLQPIAVRDWFDVPHRCARRFFQVGTPSLDYPRSDLPDNIVYVGELRPNAGALPAARPLEESPADRPPTIVVSQGTVDNDDPEKLLVPALEALKDGPYRVVATTGGRHTDALRRRFPAANVVIEDFVDFAQVFQSTAVLVCNGGYGSVMAALARGVPVVSAGVREGKNDINARLDYLGQGVDLRTEQPAAAAIARAVSRILDDERVATKVAEARIELGAFDSFEIIDRCLREDGVHREPRDTRAATASARNVEEQSRVEPL
jgi:UDP:flavonoid glycosyltransferase YjiC (YdhE family)